MYDKKLAAEHFSEMLRCKTVSGNEKDFSDFHSILKDMYPNVYDTCEYELIDKKGMMFRWKGKSSDGCVILMSHYDVVPADKDQWEHPPFSGNIANERIWGRGAIDTKCTLCAIMESVEALISEGFTPVSDIYMCFGGDEETAGDNAVQMADELKNRNIKPFLILDEGGAVLDGSIAGINNLCALVGIAEKGYMDIEFIAKGKGGHSSLAKTSNPIYIMAEVIKRINGNLFKPHISEPLKLMIKSAVKHTNFKYRIIFRNHWLRRILFKKFFLKAMPEMIALTNTVGAITQISGGSAENIIPEQVRAVGNFRIINGSSVKETLDIIKNALSDLNVEVNLISGLEPSEMSDTTGRGWSVLSETITDLWNDGAVIPYLMLARSDSRSYSKLSDNIYRFSPLIMTKEERSSIHGINENILLDSFYKIIDFYIKLIKKI